MSVHECAVVLRTLLGIAEMEKPFCQLQALYLYRYIYMSIEDDKDVYEVDSRWMCYHAQFLWHFEHLLSEKAVFCLDHSLCAALAKLAMQVSTYSLPC